MRATRYCATRERAPQEVRRYLERHGASGAEIGTILDQLQQGGFLDEARYARAFARDRARFSGWGSLKIAAALRAKSLPQSTIDQALATVREEGDTPDLSSILRKKRGTLKPDLGPHELKVRLMRFAASRGFAYEEAIEHIDRLLRHEP